MDHGDGGEVPTPTKVESTGFGMSGAVHGGAAHMASGTFHGQLVAATARRASFEPTAAAYEYDDNYSALQLLPGTEERGVVLVDLLPDGAAGHGEVFVDLLPDGMAAERLRRLVAFAGICACSVAANGLVAGPGSPAVAFCLFALLLGGLFLVMLHVLLV